MPKIPAIITTRSRLISVTYGVPAGNWNRVAELNEHGEQPTTKEYTSALRPFASSISGGTIR